MKKLTRLFLLCLAMIAIPVQGIAAAGMMNCCCAKHQPATSAEESKPGLDKQVSEAASHAMHDDSSSAEKKCGCCANCCCGCGSAMSSCSAPASNSSSEKINSIFSSQKGHVNDGLERPPRD